MRKDDMIRVRHMLDAAREALSFVKNKERKDLDDDRMLVLSLVKLIEIIGEAASKVTDDTKTKYSDIPWSNITGMRNRHTLQQKTTFSTPKMPLLASSMPHLG